jgi:DMSO/TMAO reductase YedYZ molybdopterin-dependent catalytic subunit
VDGLVDRPLTLPNELKTLPKVEQFATLACISNPVGGDLISTTLFTGARLKMS